MTGPSLPGSAPPESGKARALSTATAVTPRMIAVMRLNISPYYAGGGFVSMWFATLSSRGRGDYDRVIPLTFDGNPDLGTKQQSLYLRLVREAPDN